MKIPKQYMTKQIRLKCIDCCGGDVDENRFCAITDCALWYFRFGTSPMAYINRSGKKSKILFDPKAFEKDGIFASSKTAAEVRKIYKNLSSKDAQELIEVN